MAEEMGDKTEAATPKRRLEAREQGNIPRSPDLTAAVLLIGILLLLRSFGGGLVRALRDFMAEMLSLGSLQDVNPAGVGPILVRAIVAAGTGVAPLLIGVVIIALLANIAQTGLFFNMTRLQPNIAALNPFKGLSRLFGGGQGFVKLVMSLMKVGLVSLTAYSAIHGKMREIVYAQSMSYTQVFGVASGIIYSITLRIGLLLFVLALLDYVYQRYRIEKEIKMSKQEVKEEMKRMEGDPHIKARRRQLAMAQHRERLKNDVPKADVIVTNPTEFAIALKYDPNSMNAPKVVAKGQGYWAARIREIAIANGIPILERKPLARALFKLCNVGQEIPEQFFSAVAEILAYVYELSGKLKQKEREYLSSRSKQLIT